MIRAPRSEVIGGWFGGNPTERGSAAMFGIRMGWGSRVRAPSRPWPTGGFPRAARSSGAIPRVMNSWIIDLWGQDIERSAARAREVYSELDDALEHPVERELRREHHPGTGR